MLFVDSSALVKRYLREAGSGALRARLESADRVFVSALTYAETLTAFARRFRESTLTQAEFQKACDDFLWDWTLSLDILEVDGKTMTSVLDLVTRYHIKAADAVQLSTALWLRDVARFKREFKGQLLEFVAADESLCRIAGQCGLRVFNPQASP